MGCVFSTCKCDKTSFFRHDDEPVPAVEKLKSIEFETCAPKTMEELQEYGERNLETGDILIMHCTHGFGKIAQIATGSVWDHVAMIVRLPTDDQDAIHARMALLEKAPRPISKTMPWPKPGEEGPVEVFEAMGGGVYSYPFVAHLVCRGPVCKYVAVRKLRDADGNPLNREAQQKVEAFVQEFWARPYESGNAGLFELARPIFNQNPRISMKRDKSKEALDNLFCSELIAEAYQAAGLLPEETLNSNEVLPSMFAPGKTIDKYLEREAHGFKLGPAEIFKAPSTPLSKDILDRRKQLQDKLVNNMGIKEENLLKPL